MSNAEGQDAPKVVYVRGTTEIDLMSEGFNRHLRRLLNKEGEKLKAKFGHLVHPETGERPDVVLHLSEDKVPKVTGRLRTDSAPLRDWLKEQGVPVHQEVDASVPPAAEEAA